MWKRILCRLCVAALLCSLLLIPVSAADTVETGKLGDNITYTWNKTTGQAVISGSGEMWRFGKDQNLSPFCRSDALQSVTVEAGVTSLGDYLFTQCTNLREVTLPNTLRTISHSVFDRCKALEEIVLPQSVELLGELAFSGCERLQSVYFCGDYPKYLSWYDEMGIEPGTGDWRPFAWSNESSPIYLYHMAGSRWPEEFWNEGVTQCIPVLVASDVPANAWYTSDVMQAYRLGLMNGVAEQRFAPQQPTTRGMLLTLLHRMAGEPQATHPAPFPDTAGRYYSAAIDWAAEAGLAKGCPDGTFAPDAPITREQLAVFLWRYARYLGDEATVDPASLNFPDAGAVHSYAMPAMAWAVDSGIIQGVSTGGDTLRLEPQGSATRAQTAAVLIRFLALNE